MTLSTPKPLKSEQGKKKNNHLLNKDICAEEYCIYASPNSPICPWHHPEGEYYKNPTPSETNEALKDGDKLGEMIYCEAKISRDLVDQIIYIVNQNDLYQNTRKQIENLLSEKHVET